MKGQNHIYRTVSLSFLDAGKKKVYTYISLLISCCDLPQTLNPWNLPLNVTLTPLQSLFVI